MSDRDEGRTMEVATAAICTARYMLGEALKDTGNRDLRDAIANALAVLSDERLEYDNPAEGITVEGIEAALDMVRTHGRAPTETVEHLSDMDTGEPMSITEAMALGRRAAMGVEARRDENVKEWAKRLGGDIAAVEHEDDDIVERLEAIADAMPSTMHEDQRAIEVAAARLRRSAPREPIDDARAAYMNIRTCICGEDASKHHCPHGLEGEYFDPDWERVRKRLESFGSAPREVVRASGTGPNQPKFLVELDDYQVSNLRWALKWIMEHEPFWWLHSGDWTGEVRFTLEDIDLSGCPAERPNKADETPPVDAPREVVESGPYPYVIVYRNGEYVYRGPERRGRSRPVGPPIGDEEGGTAETTEGT